jgi:CelD/BcsL family acetyltransferase involved in cellulose biosynthesis
VTASASSQGGLATARISPGEVTDALPEWIALFERSGSRNPFAHPVWLTTWAHHFATEEDLHLIAVRQGEELVGLAPFYRHRGWFGGRHPVRFLRLLGSGRETGLTELSQVLIRPGLERRVLRAVMHHVLRDEAEWDLIELTLPPEQGWFEPDWLPEDGGRAFFIHKDTAPCVVMPLDADWHTLRSGLKRNVKESLRRGVNRLERDGHSWSVPTPSSPTEVQSALTDLLRLHSARARMDSSVLHANRFASPTDTMLLFDLGYRLGQSGHVSPRILTVDGIPAAGLLMLRANDGVFLSFSGLEPRWWDYSPQTILVEHCLHEAALSGAVFANLSVGPDRSKLRWSERLELYNSFMIVGDRPRAALAFGAYWQLRPAAGVHRDSTGAPASLVAALRYLRPGRRTD